MPATAAAREEVIPMFKELTEELLDLRTREKGYRNALYASWAVDAGCTTTCTCVKRR